jgi:hypothetical protein
MGLVLNSSTSSGLGQNRKKDTLHENLRIFMRLFLVIETFADCELRTETQETVDDLNFSPFTRQVGEMRYLDAEYKSVRKTHSQGRRKKVDSLNISPKAKARERLMAFGLH